MATACCSDSKMIFFHGSANERSEKLRPQNCSQYFVESKAEVLLKLPIVRYRTAGKHFAMLSRQVEQNVILPGTFVAHSHHRKKDITPLSPIRNVLRNCSGLSTLIRGILRRNALFGWLPWYSCGPASY